MEDKDLLLDVIERIKKKKEFQRIHHGLIEKIIRINKTYKKFIKSKREKDKKLVIKQVRALLRKIITPMPQTFYKKFNYFLNNIDSKKVINTLLRLNQATRERHKEAYLWLIRKINEIKPKKIYDFGCGINLIALCEYGFSLNKMAYLGFDVDGYITELVNKFAKIKKINAKVINNNLSCIDLNKIDKELNKKKNIILCLKVFDAFEEIEKNSTKKILKIKEKKIVSFPTISLSGKKRIKERGWFERLLKIENKKFEKRIFNNEIFYIID